MKRDKEAEKKNDSPTSRSGKSENFGFSSVSEFFAWMKKLGVEKIEFDFNTNQVVISCKGNKKLNVSDGSSGLTSQQQQALNERFKSETSPITFSQIQGELEKGNKGNTGKVGIIAAILVVGLVLVAVVGVVIYKSRRKERDYY